MMGTTNTIDLSKLTAVFNTTLSSVFRFLKLFPLVLVTFGVLSSHSYSAPPRTPSQALPKMFQRPATLDYYEFKKM